MKLNKVEIKNYRSIEALSLELPNFYTAISGKNNSGKSNVIRILQILFSSRSRFFQEGNDDLSFSRDFPLWKHKDKDNKRDDLIEVEIQILLDKDRDASLYKFAVNLLNLEETQPNPLKLDLRATQSREKPQLDYTVLHGTREFDSFISGELFRRIRNSRAFQFYDSTESDESFLFREKFSGLFSELSTGDKDTLEKDKTKLAKTLGGIAKRHQRDITELLGRLEEKYTVGLSIPNLNFEYLPFEITLGDKQVDVDLEAWGSGTQNRTRILLTLFRAKKMSDSIDSGSKVAPILFVEEPECYLHPSAQAEFGRMLQDLALEFQIQVITATHSPYFLSQQAPESNILLGRSTVSKQLRQTEKIPTKDENWMEPFGLALGIANTEFEPWKQALFNASSKILLVEGDIDKDYFELLRNEEHGNQALKFQGEIFPYGGKDTLKNQVLLRFIKNRYDQIFITFDLDCETEVSKVLVSLGFEKGKHFLAVGQQKPGMNNIEGLLPESVRAKVFAENSALVQQALSAVSDEARSAKQRLKRLFLEEFKIQAKPSEEHFGEFYKLSKQINKQFL